MLRLICLTCLCLCLGLPARAEALVVFAAASLRGALDELAEGWPGEITLSYAGTATLARQIEAGAPADLFLSANAAWMAHLVAAGLVTDPTPFLGNQLVLVGHGSPSETLPQALDALPPDARLATGLLTAVPAGIYAAEALARAERLETLRPRIVQVENVRLALALASRGDVAAALVYRSDALAAPDLTLLAPVPPEAHSPIRYHSGLIAESAAARRFQAHLLSPEARAIFARHGFEPRP